MNWTPRRERFRAILAGDRCELPISVYDAMSARMAQELEFPVAMLAGSVAAMTVMAAPDLVQITASEFADVAYRINRAAELPLIVDADHGYGNALNVARTAAELDHAGIAAMTVEDTVLPLAHGSGGAAQLCSVEEGVGKMHAALDGRDDNAMAVIGRTSAARITGIDNAIARAKVYADAGVDAIALIGIRERAELEAAAAAIDLPIMLGGVAPELLDPDLLAGLGVRICLRGHQPYMAAQRACYETMLAQKQGDALPPLADKDQIDRWTEAADATRMIEDYL